MAQLKEWKAFSGDIKHGSIHRIYYMMSNEKMVYVPVVSFKNGDLKELQLFDVESFSKEADRMAIQEALTWPKEVPVQVVQHPKPKKDPSCTIA